MKNNQEKKYGWDFKHTTRGRWPGIETLKIVLMTKLVPECNNVNGYNATGFGAFFFFLKWRLLTESVSRVRLHARKRKNKERKERFMVLNIITFI